MLMTLLLHVEPIYNNLIINKQLCEEAARLSDFQTRGSWLRAVPPDPGTCITLEGKIRPKSQSVYKNDDQHLHSNSRASYKIPTGAEFHLTPSTVMHFWAHFKDRVGWEVRRGIRKGSDPGLLIPDLCPLLNQQSHFEVYIRSTCKALNK